MKLIDNYKDKNIISPAYMYRKYGEIDVSDVEDEEIGVRVFSELQKQYGLSAGAAEPGAPGAGEAGGDGKALRGGDAEYRRTAPEGRQQGGL